MTSSNRKMFRITAANQVVGGCEVLIDVIEIAIDLSLSMAGETFSVFDGSEKIGAFCAGRRVFPVRGIVNLRDLEDEAMLNALESTGGNIRAAARCLGISQTTLYRRTRGVDKVRAMAAGL
jgi:transcriptional regulator of acetoin/glycerol metabolism